MPNIILHKRNSTPGTVPTSGALSQGELGINIGDGKLYTKNSSNNIINIGVTSISGTNITPASGNFSNYLAVNGVHVSISGHSHISVPQAQSLVTNVFNKTASTIPKFSAVYINGGQGDQPTIQLAIGNGEAGSSRTYGITAEAITSMSTGNVIVAGALSGVNTDQFNPTAPVGDVNGIALYLSPSTSGGLTTTKPYAPNHLVYMATIVRTHQNEGIIEVKIQNGFELQELHNVSIGGITGGEFLSYNGATSLWIANPNLFSSGSNIGIGTSSPGSTLDVRGSAVFNENGDNVDFRIEGDTDSNLFFVDASADKIGIGTNSPSNILSVVGNENVFSVVGDDLTYGGQSPASTIKGYTWFGKSDGSVGIGAHHADAGVFDSVDDFFLFEGFNENVTSYTPICLSAGYDAQLFLDTSLNVGIGIATPGSKLHVISDFSCGIDPKNGGTGMYVDGNQGSVSIIDSGPQAIATINSDGGLTLYANGGAGGAEILSTDRSNLRIGIGTIIPSSTLHVVGDTNIDGNLTFDSFTESVVSNGNSGTSKTLSLASGTVHTCTLTGNCTFTMPTTTAGKSFTMFLNTGSGNYTASFIGVRWADSATPTATITANKVDIFSFISDGSYWYGSFSQNYG